METKYKLYPGTDALDVTKSKVESDILCVCILIQIHY